ncbi:MAG: FkbM family methyltransferase [Dactylosporangium sp.]|nr:FkbM family methyltransferase [Dactylosporangium sp.]NNJ61203.1 FkbM family methyltransferase [Dactylosporangium sp.]
MSLLQRTSLSFIKWARRACADSRVQKLAVVKWLYRMTVNISIGGGKEVTTDFRGLRLAVPGGDYVFIAGLTAGFYESIELDLAERLARQSRTIIDVGANIGIYSCVLASHMPDEGRLISFEPVPDNMTYLRRNLAGNALSDRVVLEQLAVGEAPGESMIHLVDRSGNHSLAPDVAVNSSCALPVLITSLDTYLRDSDCRRSVDLLKIDVEGYDGYVLRGATTLLLEQRPTLLVEFEPNHLTNAGFSPTEFLDMIFTAYSDVYVIDDPRGLLVRCNRNDIVGQHANAANLNLVATWRSDHVETIERYRQTLNTTRSSSSAPALTR